jgi:hemerythrin-like metal-binding protein
MEMPLIAWDQSYSVGVKLIDTQHSELFDALNDLHAAMIQGKQKETTSRLLKDLIAYTRGHFTSEEAMLARSGYPQLDAHRQRHRELTEEVEGYVQRFEKGEAALSVHLIGFLRNWLTNHIQREDRAYSGWVMQRGFH